MDRRYLKATEFLVGTGTKDSYTRIDVKDTNIHYSKSLDTYNFNYCSYLVDVFPQGSPGDITFQIQVNPSATDDTSWFDVDTTDKTIAAGSNVYTNAYTAIVPTARMRLKYSIATADDSNYWEVAAIMALFGV